MEKPIFTPIFWETLADANPHGSRVDVAVVHAWFDWKWPKLKARGYRNMKRATANWWAAISPGELVQAKARAVQLADAAENERLARLAQTDAGFAPRSVTSRRGRFHLGTAGRS